MEGAEAEAARSVSAAAAMDGNATADDDYLSEYEYSYEDSVGGSIAWKDLLPVLVPYSLTLALGVVGNALIIYTVCRYRRLKSATNVFLASLASADLLLVLVCVPLKTAKLFSFTWSMGFFLCKLMHYLQTVSAICSVLTLTAMSIERYYAIVHPMRAKYTCTISQARKVIVAVWLSSFPLAMPILFAQVHVEVGAAKRGFWCIKSWENVPLWRFNELYMLLVILVVPTAVMAAMYSAICSEVWRVAKRRYGMTSGGISNSGSCRRRPQEVFPLRYSKNGRVSVVQSPLVRTTSCKPEGEDIGTVKQVIKMLVAVVVLFVICWAPLLVDNVLTAFNVLPKMKTGGLQKMNAAFTVMAYFNSCINPIVYGFMSKNFRDSFLKAMCRCCYQGNPSFTASARHPSLSQTRTTSVRYVTSCCSACCCVWSECFCQCQHQLILGQEQPKPMAK